MKKLILSFIILLITSNVFTQKLDNAAIHRIGDYCKLWAVINLFHPQMAYNTINADSLFTDNINELIKDPSAASFKNAVQKMIGRLDDPYTRIKDKNKSLTDTIDISKRPLLRWLADSIALLHFDAPFINQIISTRNNAPLLQLFDSINKAPGFIIDLRKNSFTSNGLQRYFENLFLMNLTGLLSNQNTGFPSKRTRIHYGYEDEAGSGSAIYFKGWMMQNGSKVYPGREARNKPVCVIVNRYGETFSDGIATMQKAGIAKVVADGSLGNFVSASTYEMLLADSIVVEIRLSEILYPDGSKEFLPDTIITHNADKNDDSFIQTAVYLLKSKRALKKTTDQPIQDYFVSSKVEGYDSLTYPSAPLRLLGMIRYWSAINYFSPNKDLIKKNWDSVLYEYVPVFLKAKDSIGYVFAAARLINQINDTHGYLNSPVFKRLFEKAPPVQFKYIKDKTIVYRVYDDSLKQKLSPGDEIIAVDDIRVKKLRDSLMQYTGASNNASLQREVNFLLLAGRVNTSVKINVLHNGKQVQLTLFRSAGTYQYETVPREGPIWKKLNNKIGYIDFGRLETADVDSMFTALKNTDAIIIDNRSYPKGTAGSIISYLTDKPVKAIAFTTIIADSPEPLVQNTHKDIAEYPVTPKALYKGRIIILVNETTQSQAEGSCMLLQAASKKITIIGSQTSGADGDVTYIKMPGGMSSRFSGAGVYYPDGRPTQGIGILPDIEIKPTIKGIKAGRDEVLERAILFAKTGK